MTKIFALFVICLTLIAMLVLPTWANTYALTPTPTPTAPIICTPLVLSVNPVVSPTSALTQIITARASGGGLYKFNVFVRDTAGNLLGTYSSTPSGSTASITINLNPGVTHNLTVTVNG